MIALETLPGDVRQVIAGLQAEVAYKDAMLKFKDEQIRLLNIRLFGARGEKLSPGQIQLLLEEASVSAGEVAQEAERPEEEKQNPLPKARKRRTSHPGRAKLPEHLERRKVIIPCHPDDCRCDQCGAERPVIGYETREELGCQPAVFFVNVIMREKRGSHCHEEQGVATAAVPAQIVPKSKLSNQFIIEAVVEKYQQHLPAYRQCAVLWENHGIDLCRKTLTDAILAAGALLGPVVRAQAAELMRGDYLQADETTMPCQTPEKTGHNHRAFVWEYGRPQGPVVFDFQMGRGRDGPLAFLKGFRGVLQSDGYSAYAELGEGIVYAGCMAHARRGFVEASKLAEKDPRPVEIMARIGKLYDVEREAREAGMGSEERKTLRQTKSVPLMAALKLRLVEMRQQLPPAEKLAKACDYALNQWTRLEVFLSNGQVEIDNNWCEGGMRPLVLGRKNWLHIGSEQAGPKVAAIVSIVETCRRLKINLRQYLTDVLPKLGDWPASRVAELTPTVWKAAQKS
jgi:transposase